MEAFQSISGICNDVWGGDMGMGGTEGATKED